MFPRVCLVFLCTLLAGCAQVARPPHLYRATIESVRWSEGQHYTLGKGYGVRHEIALRVHPGGIACKLVLFDIYSPGVFGDEHDEISFLYAGRLPASARIWLDQLKGYRVERRRGNRDQGPRTSDGGILKTVPSEATSAKT